MAIHLNINADDAREFLHNLRTVAGPLVERGVDGDDGTVDHDHLAGIDLDDGTWRYVNAYNLPGSAAEFLAELRNGPVVTRHCRVHDDDCGVVTTYRKRA